MTPLLAALLTYGVVSACYYQWFAQHLSTPQGRRGLRRAQVRARRRPTEFAPWQRQLVAVLMAVQWPLLLAQALRDHARRRALRR